MDNMGMRIKQKREEKHLTMEELGAMVGVGASAVNKWEKGHVTNMKRSTIKKLSDIFSCSPAWLMGYLEKDISDEDRFKNQIMFEITDPDVDELVLINDFRALNEEGQKRFKDYLSDLLSMDKYTCIDFRREG